MPRVIDLADASVAELAETADAIAARGFDPGDDDNLGHAARWLRRLGNNPTFLAICWSSSWRSATARKCPAALTVRKW